jgi:hypothetical protein
LIDFSREVIDLLNEFVIPTEAQRRDLLFLFRFSHRLVILSGAPRRLIA